MANAVAYSNEGGRVGVGAKVNDGTVEIAITDQGIGIDGEELDRIFERFYRVDQARSRNTGGSGLGLSIVKHTVQNHGGDVRAWSKRGRGSTFMIRLPVAETVPESQLEGDDARREHAASQVPPASAGKPKRGARRSSRATESATRVATPDRGDRT